MQRGHKGNVLIVDNDERILWAFQEHLENAGFDTEATWSGHEALALLRTGEFDILLVDDYFPDLRSRFSKEGQPPVPAAFDRGNAQ